MKKNLLKFWDWIRGVLFGSGAAEDSKTRAKRTSENAPRRNIKRAMNEMSHTLNVLQRVHTPSGCLSHVSAPAMEAYLATTGPTWVEANSEATVCTDYCTPDTIPAIGAVAFGYGTKNAARYEKVAPDFFGWMRLKNTRWPNLEVARPGEIVVQLYYMFTLYDERGRVWFNPIIAIDPRNNTARALRIKSEIPSPNGGAQWAFRPQRMPDNEPVDAEKEKEFFYWFVNIWFTRDTRWQVQMAKGRRRLTFGLPNNEARHWFRQRITAQATDGKRKRILHEVISHYRKTKKGTTTVKPHLRGEREFIWNGCRTRINIDPREMQLFHTFRAEAEPRDKNESGPVFTPYSLGKALRDS